MSRAIAIISAYAETLDFSSVRQIARGWPRSSLIAIGRKGWRALVVLLTVGRLGTNEIMRRTGLGTPSVWRWQERYIEAGVDGFCATRHDRRAFLLCPTRGSPR